MTPLPADFLDALAGHDEVQVTSREGNVYGTVPVWFVVGPPGVVYLFSFGFSTKVRRWRSDPWVRLRVPGMSVAVEGVAHFVNSLTKCATRDTSLSALITRTWAMQGAPTREGLLRTLRDGVHALVRVEGQPAD